jgi:serine/threonine protein kinase/Tol biopolymer transport system component
MPERETGQIAAGTKVGPYEIATALGAGGMGTVYRARDPRLNRDVALKFLSGAYATDSVALERFQREARAISALNHPNVCTVYDIGEDRGQPFLVMELLEGQTLRQRIATGRIPNDELISIALQICEALEAAHSRGIVHRDIKPANIFITSPGVVKILDFGLAKSIVATPPDSLADDAPTLQNTLTKSSITLGTVSYTSPEQVQGQEVDARSDLFSFGVVLYEMATQTLPFTGESWPAILNAILTSEPRALREVNPAAMPEIEKIVEKALEKQPRTRYQTVSDMKADLLRARRSLDRIDVSAGLEVKPQPRSRRGMWAIVGVLALVAVLGAAAALKLFNQTAVPTSPSEYIQITNFTDSAIWPSLSPDGKMVTFLRGGGSFPTKGQIYVKLLPNGDSVELTKGGATRFGPVFTPDGTRIAYTEVVAGASGVSWDTWTVPVLGGQPSRLLPNASGLSWLDDQHVLFSEVMTGLHMGIVTSMQGRAQERQIYFPEHERAMAHLSYASSDRKSVLIVEMDRTGAFSEPCRLVPFDGSSPVRFVGPQGGCTAAGWSPDGKWMYFAVTVNDRSHLWRERFPDGKPEQISFGPTEEEGIAVAPDGKSLITAVGIRQSSVWSHDSSGDKPVSSEGFASSPVLSRDGQRVYYLLRQNVDSSALELRSVDQRSGKTDVLLQDLPVVDYDISHDERSVVFTTQPSARERQIWLASLDHSSPPRTIVQGGDSAFFGAEGEIIFRQLGEKSNSLSRIKLDGTHRELAAETPILGLSDVSRDGEWAVVGFSGQDAPSHITAVPIRGGRPRIICTYCQAVWSRDGKFFYVRFPFNKTSPEKTLAFPLRTPNSPPDLPAEGISSDWTPPAGVKIVDRAVMYPGPDPSTYVFTKTDLQRNLFRIPLH